MKRSLGDHFHGGRPNGTRPRVSPGIGETYIAALGKFSRSTTRSVDHLFDVPVLASIFFDDRLVADCGSMILVALRAMLMGADAMASCDAEEGRGEKSDDAENRVVQRRIGVDEEEALLVA